MHKIWTIALREYRAIVGTKAFVIAIILMPVLMFGGIAVQKMLEGRVGPADAGGVGGRDEAAGLEYESPTGVLLAFLVGERVANLSVLDIVEQVGDDCVGRGFVLVRLIVYCGGGPGGQDVTL